MILFCSSPVVMSLRGSFSMQVVESEHILQNEEHAKHEEPLE